MGIEQQYDADAFLSGGGAPSAKFAAFGDTYAGQIVERPTVQQQRDFQSGEPKFWKDGNPMMQLVVTIATQQRDASKPDDDGHRRLYVKGALKAAVQQALKAAGAKGLEVGGVLSVTYTHDGEQSNPKMSAPKQFKVTYTPAATAALSTPDPAPQPAPVAAVPSTPANPLANLNLADPQVQALLGQIAQQQGQQAAPQQPASPAIPF